jgi:penicillin-binding protein 1B
MPVMALHVRNIMTGSKRRPVKLKSAKSNTMQRAQRAKKISVKHLFKKYRVLLLMLAVAVFGIYLAYLDHEVTTMFKGRLWQLPARVYARPLEIYQGEHLSANDLLGELKLLNYTQVSQIPSGPGQYHRWDNHFEIKTRAFKFYDGAEKSIGFRLNIDNDQIVALDDLYSGDSVALVRLDPAYIAGIFPSHREDRVLLKLNEVPDIFIKTLVLIEDKRFFEHHGVDPHSIARAFVADMKAGEAVQGGSTITQQLVKNLFLSPSQNLWRKANEALMALLLELHYSKQLILETYINEVYLGQDQDRAIHGFGLASEYYFGKPLQQTTVDQMALLVGMVKGASYYNPVRNPVRASERRKVVLNTMAANGLLTQLQADLLAKKPIQVTQHRRRSRYPAFIDLVERQLQDNYSAEDLSSEGLQIFTTLDPIVQDAADDAVKKVLPKIDYRKQGLQTAVVVVAPDSGDVLAMVGDRTPSFAGYNRALDASRQIGSLIKPVIYLAALQHPDRYTLATILDDSPLRVMGDDKKIWAPQNYDNEYHGKVLLFDALLHSYNIPAARTGLDVGLADIVKTLHDLGSPRDLPPYPSITLGAVPMTPFEVASVYQTFAAAGFHSPLRSVLAVLDNSGKPLSRYDISVKRKINPDAISLVNYTLSKITQTGTAQRLAKELNLAVAGKTGTTNDLRDSWFAGFSGDLVSVVWVGNDDNQPAGITGATGALRVWSALMAKAAHRPFKVAMSENIKMDWVDPTTGELSEQRCQNAIELPFITGSEPTTSSDCAGSTPSNWLRGIFN